MKYCLNCKQNIEAKRNIGIGTLILVLCTLGWWLLLIPFYTKRCPLCKGTNFGNESDNKRKCPFCGELIQADAKICRFCQKELLGIVEPKILVTNGLWECKNCHTKMLIAGDYCSSCRKHKKEIAVTE
jgi:hypothetical protein